MNKEEFNQLGIIEQMNCMNDLLATGISLTEACNSIGIDRATVRKRFKSKEISFSKEHHKYIFDVPVEKYGVDAIRKKEASKKETTEEKLNKLDNIKSKLDQHTKEQKEKDYKRLLDVEVKVSLLEVQMENMKKLLESNTTNNTTTTKANIHKYEGVEVVRSYRVNGEVQKRFKDYCKAHSEHKVSDILSTILEEYLNNN